MPSRSRRSRRCASRPRRPGAPWCRRWRRSCTSRCRCSTTASSASSTTWATTPRSCRRRASPTAAAPGRSATIAGLIHYLMRHRHTTPFEMCEIKLHVKLPIFVARQWIRHRTANVNEYSARYSILDGRVLPARAGAPRRAVRQQPPGPRRRCSRARGRRGARHAARRRRAGLRRLPRAAQPGRGGRGARARARRASRASSPG